MEFRRAKTVEICLPCRFAIDIVALTLQEIMTEKRSTWHLTNGRQEFYHLKQMWRIPLSLWDFKTTYSSANKEGHVCRMTVVLLCAYSVVLPNRKQRQIGTVGVVLLNIQMVVKHPTSKCH